MCEDLLHHAIRTGVTILERQTEQEALSVYQAIINPPGIDTDAVQRSRELPCFAQSREGFVPQREDIPEAVPAQRHRPIGKAMDFLQTEISPVETCQHHASALGTKIDGCDIACRHGFSPLCQRGYAAATPPSTLRMLPVLLMERVGEAKNATASAISSGRMLTPSVVRLRYTSSS